MERNIYSCFRKIIYLYKDLLLFFLIMKKWAIVLFSNGPYINKAFSTIDNIRNVGLWKDDIVLLVSKDLYNNENTKNEALKYNVILKELPEVNIDSILNAWEKHKTHHNYEYIMTRKYMYMKFYVFDKYFRDWNVVFYIDSGMKIYDNLERMKINCEPSNNIYAHSDSYPEYIWKLKCQFNLELFNDEENLEINNKYNLDINYFQGTTFIYDTKIIEDDTVEKLFELAFKYKYSHRMDQGILNLHFNCERNLWKQMPIKDESGFLYDYLCRKNYSNKDYLMLKI